jgi:hypothetical protein
MKKLVVLGLALLGMLASTLSHATWNPEWKQRVKIGLNTSPDGLPIAAAVDSVPVLVRLHTGNFQFVEAKPDGTDLRFISADDKTPLKYHIEKFDGLNELALIWVQLPKLAAGSKTDFIWLYYGNPGAAAGDDAKGSYDAAQGLVYHFSEREAVPQDSTANANHAVRSTAKVSGSGLIGGGVTFDGNSELALPSTPSLRSNANGLTLSFWIKPVDAADAAIYTQTEGAAPLKVLMRAGKLVAQSGGLTATASVPLTPGAWQHVAVVVKDGLALFVAGQESARMAGSVPDLSGAAVIGKGFKGDIDELQISTTARSADWIKTAAQSQGQDQKLVAYGQAEGEGEGEGDTGPSYLKILLGAVTLDGWIVIGILGVMFVVSVWVMTDGAADDLDLGRSVPRAARHGRRRDDHLRGHRRGRRRERQLDRARHRGGARRDGRGPRRRDPGAVRLQLPREPHQDHLGGHARVRRRGHDADRRTLRGLTSRHVRQGPGRQRAVRRDQRHADARSRVRAARHLHHHDHGLGAGHQGQPAEGVEHAEPREAHDEGHHDPRGRAGLPRHVPGDDGRAGAEAHAVQGRDARSSPS